MIYIKVYACIRIEWRGVKKGEKFAILFSIIMNKKKKFIKKVKKQKRRKKNSVLCVECLFHQYNHFLSKNIKYTVFIGKGF